MYEQPSARALHLSKGPTTEIASTITERRKLCKTVHKLPSARSLCLSEGPSTELANTYCNRESLFSILYLLDS